MTHGELIAALLKVEGNRPDSLGISTQWYRNPEGPQAVEALTAAQAEIEALRAFALKAFTIVEWATGEGFVLEPPHYDCDDTYLEGVALLGVETADEARAALSGSQP